MKQQLITFETAKLAKEKGFDNSGNNSFYNSKGILITKITGLLVDFYCHSATQSLLQKWLREKHNIHVNPVPFRNYSDGQIVAYYCGEIYSKCKLEYEGLDYYDTYEEALEIGLKEALELI